MGFINERIFILKFAATTYKESETNNTLTLPSNTNDF
ncbi:hypothetical protein HS1_002405 [Candidatus Desulfofervidus auxilii]|uniref:Uncharacterized protein n=1 Tax=Desulfofervidus auxilii TaxID=1621989 RepID=A0A7U4QMQ7_DESA2|nr:hypothetical protein HS1_002405 [Candidatus Desulfofervidus auxilii]